MNWYKKADSLHQTHDRFEYQIKFGIWVPKGMGPDEAYQVLIARMPKMLGWSSEDTPDINGNISMDGMEEIR
jgi:hypothetical protein